MEIFVFGSNLAGRHGKGAALHAKEYYGAQPGVGVGRTAGSYAIPTKDEKLDPLPLEKIEKHVKTFLQYAREHADLDFFVTRIGCGLAGYTNEQIAPMFKGAPVNCQFDAQWKPLLKEIDSDISLALEEDAAWDKASDEALQKTEAQIAEEENLNFNLMQLLD